MLTANQKFQQFQEAVGTGVDKDLPASSGNRRFLREWQTAIDSKLLPWLKRPHDFEDEGVEAPTNTVVRIALDTAEQLRDMGYAPPHDIVLDPNGGIIFEQREDDGKARIYIWNDGAVEYMYMLGTRIVERCPLQGV